MLLALYQRKIHLLQFTTYNRVLFIRDTWEIQCVPVGFMTVALNQGLLGKLSKR
jgi:hypothetical protein